MGIMKLSEMSVEELRKTPWFHNVDPSKLSSLDDFAAWLEAILHNPCSVWEEDGECALIEIRQLVDRVYGLRIEVYSNEHPPPHFHVKSPNVDASFTIEGCDLISGNIDARDLKKIQFWFKYAKPKIVEVWNSTRPSDCVVGEFQPK